MKKRGHVTSGSPIGHAQWYYCTTTIVRKIRGKSSCACAHPKEPLRVTSLPVALSVMHDGTTTIVVVQNVPVAHAHAITSGSTISHHLRKYDFVRAHILLIYLVELPFFSLVVFLFFCVLSTRVSKYVVLNPYGASLFFFPFFH